MTGEELREIAFEFARTELPPFFKAYESRLDTLWQLVRQRVEARARANDDLDSPAGADAATTLVSPQQPSVSERIAPVINIPDDLVTAPFRFVPISSQIATPRAAGRPEAIPLDKPVKENLCATIEVEWEVETPLLIGETRDEGNGAHVIPFELPSAPGRLRYAIPGATLRGAMRSVMEILAFGRLSQIDRKKEFRKKGIGTKKLESIVTNSGEGHKPHREINSLEEMRVAADFVERLFGYVYQPEVLGLSRQTKPIDLALKGRLAFGFARPSRDSVFALLPPTGPIETVLATPKPSFEPFYLAGPEKSYFARTTKTAAGDTSYPQLAGRKRYIVRRRKADAEIVGPRYMLAEMKRQLEALPDSQENVDGSKRDDGVSTRLQFLRPETGAAFKGEIRFHNVSPAEFGAVLWALTFGGETEGEKPRRHLLGHAKPFGAGQVFVRRITGKVRWNDQAKPREEVDWNAAGGRAGIETFLAAFEQEIARLAGFGEGQTGVAAWRASPPVAGLLRMAEPRGWAAPRTRYLDYIDAEGKQAGDFQKLKQLTMEGGPMVLLPP